MTTALLQVSDAISGYGASRVLLGMELRVGAAEVVALMGRNGMGKTTTIRTILGLLPLKGGDIQFGGRSVRGMPVYRIARAGIGLVPEGRCICASLTVEENLIATQRPPPGGGAEWTLAAVYELFPRLAERRRNYGNQLSGGEQQFLAIGRALLTNPRLLILDEATEGLAPLIREQVWHTIEHLKRAGQSILIVDKDIDALARLADRHVVIEKGRVVWEGDRDKLERDRPQVLRLMGI